MTVFLLGLIGGGWFTAGLVWWLVLLRLGLRFRPAGRPMRSAPVPVPEALRRRAAALDREAGRQRSHRAVLN